MKIFQMSILFETIKFHHMGPLEAGGPGQLPPLPPLNPALSWTRRGRPAQLRKLEGPNWST